MTFAGGIFLERRIHSTPGKCSQSQSISEHNTSQLWFPSPSILWNSKNTNPLTDHLDNLSSRPQNIYTLIFTIELNKMSVGD